MEGGPTAIQQQIIWTQEPNLLQISGQNPALQSNGNILTNSYD